MSKKLCVLGALAGFWVLLCLGCVGDATDALLNPGPDPEAQQSEAPPSDLTNHDVEIAALKNAPEWQQPLMPAFEQAAAANDVPLDLLLTLGKLGSGFENRGEKATVEGGYGVMALRKNEMGGNSLELAAQLTGYPAEQLIVDPVANIAGAAAVLSAYATDAQADRTQGLEAWLPVVIKYAGMDEEDSKFFAMGVYEVM